MSVWSLEAIVVLVALIGVVIYAISRVRAENRRRNHFRSRRRP